MRKTYVKPVATRRDDTTLVVSPPAPVEVHLSGRLVDGYRAAVSIRFPGLSEREYVWYSLPLPAPAHLRDAELRRLVRATAASLLRGGPVTEVD